MNPTKTATFRFLAPGKYELRAQFLNDLRLPPRTIELTHPGQAVDVVLDIEPTGQAQIKLLGNGRALPPKVRITSPPITGPDFPEDVIMVTLDTAVAADGSIRVKGLPLGERDIEVRAAGFRPTIISVKVGDPEAETPTVTLEPKD